MDCCTQQSAGAGLSCADSGTLRIDFLFLDETVCNPCSGTGRALDEAIALTVAPLNAMGLELVLKRIHVRDEAMARDFQLLVSPTIRVNGNDIDPARTVEACGTCGEIAGGQTTVTCRNWHWRGEVYKAAPAGRIVEAILQAGVSITSGDSSCCPNKDLDDAYALPKNLKGFFANRQGQGNTCC